MLYSMGFDSYIVDILIHCLLLLQSCVRFCDVVLGVIHFAEKDSCFTLIVFMLSYSCKCLFLAGSWVGL